MVGLLPAMPLIVAGQITALEFDTELDITVNGIAPLDSSGIGLASGDVKDDGAVDIIIGVDS